MMKAFSEMGGGGAGRVCCQCAAVRRKAGSVCGLTVLTTKITLDKCKQPRISDFSLNTVTHLQKYCRLMLKSPNRIKERTEGDMLVLPPFHPCPLSLSFICHLQMSSKRSNSFRRAILQGSRQLRGCSLRDEVGLGLSQRLVRHVAYETLPREIDRKWYFDSYTYCPPPLLILAITIAEVSFLLLMLKSVWNKIKSLSALIFTIIPVFSLGVGRFLFYFGFFCCSEPAVSFLFLKCSVFCMLFLMTSLTSSSCPSVVSITDSCVHVLRFPAGPVCPAGVQPAVLKEPLPLPPSAEGPGLEVPQLQFHAHRVSFFMSQHKGRGSLKQTQLLTGGGGGKCCTPEQPPLLSCSLLSLFIISSDQDVLISLPFWVNVVSGNSKY